MICIQCIVMISFYLELEMCLFSMVILHYSQHTCIADTYLSREERRRCLKEEIELRGRLTQVDAIIEKLVESLEDAAEKLLMTERELRCGTPTGPDTDYAAGNYVRYKMWILSIYKTFC